MCNLCKLTLFITRQNVKWSLLVNNLLITCARDATRRSSATEGFWHINETLPEPRSATIVDDRFAKTRLARI